MKMHLNLIEMPVQSPLSLLLRHLVWNNSLRISSRRFVLLDNFEYLGAEERIFFVIATVQQHTFNTDF